MKKDFSFFRAYDVRGTYPKEINEEIAFKIGQAFVRFLRKKTKKKKLEIVVGQDNRLSSPALFKNLSRGIREAGEDVVDIGLSPTPMFYFAVAFYNFDGGIIITSSHNPPQYNGFKLVREKAIPLSGTTGLQEIKNLMEAPQLSSEKEGRLVKKEVLKYYVEFNKEPFDLQQLLPLKIVIDTANSVSGIVIPDILKETPLKVSHLFQRLDGSFPNHNPNPAIKENLRFLQKQVVKEKSDLGLAFDGDGDRIVFVTENGKIVSGDTITALVSDSLLKEQPGARILYDVRSSKIVKETIEDKGGVPVPNRIGHSFIKTRMREDDILFGGEFSGHYYCRRHYFCECPFQILFLILKKMSETKKSLSQLIIPFQKYYHSGEINFKVKDKRRVLEILEEKFQGGGKVSRIDGVKIVFSDWWFNLRPSNTEPLIRLVLEAETEKKLIEKREILTSLIRKTNGSD